MAHDTIDNELSGIVSHDASSQSDSGLDGLDTIEDGTVISATRKGGLVQKDFPGADLESELEDIG